MAASDRIFAYFASVDGRIVPAPDTRMTLQQCGFDPRKWRRCEAVGAKEIEKVSLIISRQNWEQRKLRNVQQKIREMDFLRQRESSARIRGAKNFTAKDVEANRNLERMWRDRQSQLERLIVSEFKPESRNSALDMEVKELPVVPHHLGQKRQGVTA